MGEVLRVFSLSIDYVAITCGAEGCGMSFAVPQRVYEDLRDSHRGFSCPNGHRRAFRGETELEAAQRETKRVREALERERRMLESARASRDRYERSARAFKGQVTKIKNRVGNGVCPCCNRTFQNLMRHMSTKHPEFKRAEGAEDDGSRDRRAGEKA